MLDLLSESAEGVGCLLKDRTRFCVRDRRPGHRRKREPRAPEHELVSRLDHDPPGAAAVDVSAVSRAEVGEDPDVLLAPKLGVVSLILMVGQ